MTRTDVVVVGGGIVGLAVAWAGLRSGQRVTLLERRPTAQGASVRNFGMVWPIGQARGPLLDLAERSRGLWLELGSAAGFEVRQCGSLHLAHHEDELALRA